MLPKWAHFGNGMEGKIILNTNKITMKQYFKCKFCNNSKKKFRTTQQKVKHLNSHLKLPLFECKICVQSIFTDNKYQLRRHIDNRHKQYNIGPGEIFTRNVENFQRLNQQLLASFEPVQMEGFDEEIVDVNDPDLDEAAQFFEQLIQQPPQQQNELLEADQFIGQLLQEFPHLPVNQQLNQPPLNEFINEEIQPDLFGNQHLQIERPNLEQNPEFPPNQQQLYYPPLPILTIQRVN